MSEHCKGCGQLVGIEEYDEKLWSIYHRIPDSRTGIEPYVWTTETYDEEDREIRNLVTEKNMHERGLCITCGRPDLSKLDTSELMTEEEAKEYHAYRAEVAAEQRMGC